MIKQVIQFVGFFSFLRIDFLWKAKLKVEQEEVETMRGINKVSGLSALRILSPPSLYYITITYIYVMTHMVTQ